MFTLAGVRRSGSLPAGHCISRFKLHVSSFESYAGTAAYVMPYTLMLILWILARSAIGSLAADNWPLQQCMFLVWFLFLSLWFPYVYEWLPSRPATSEPVLQVSSPVNPRRLATALFSSPHFEKTHLGTWRANIPPQHPERHGEVIQRCWFAFPFDRREDVVIFVVFLLICVDFCCRFLLICWFFLILVDFCWFLLILFNYSRQDFC